MSTFKWKVRLYSWGLQISCLNSWTSGKWRLRYKSNSPFTMGQQLQAALQFLRCNNFKASVLSPPPPYGIWHTWAHSLHSRSRGSIGRKFFFICLRLLISDWIDEILRWCKTVSILQELFFLTNIIQKYDIFEGNVKEPNVKPEACMKTRRATRREKKTSQNGFS